MRVNVGSWVVAIAFAASGSGHAADVGGWFADQQLPSAPPATGQAECAQAIRDASSDTTAINAYRAALCYLQAETPDLVAANAWLSRSSEPKLPSGRPLVSHPASRTSRRARRGAALP